MKANGRRVAHVWACSAHALGASRKVYKELGSSVCNGAHEIGNGKEAVTTA